MINTAPRTPEGPYPQPVLYGHVGRAPTRSKIRIINRTVPNIISLLCNGLPLYN